MMWNGPLLRSVPQAYCFSGVFQPLSLISGPWLADLPRPSRMAAAAAAEHQVSTGHEGWHEL